MEVNFDGLVGPTHHYAGLSYGNLASQGHGGWISNPLGAFQQGLRKMRLLASLGLRQGVLPPQERPDIRMLRRLGYSGTDAEVLEKAARKDPFVLAACSSASAMWAANAATVSPSSDCADGRVHFTPANLVTQFHRSLEPPGTARVLKRIFGDETRFAHHEALPGGMHFRDEGAANHIRLCGSDSPEGVEIFVYGSESFRPEAPGPLVYPARQTLEASSAVARLHGLKPDRTLFVRQNPALVDAGVFHNDVISVGNEQVLLVHSLAFAGGTDMLESLKILFERICGSPLFCWEVAAERLTVEDAVGTYLFNSQLVTLAGGDMCLIAPMECREHPVVRELMDEILDGPSPIRRVEFTEVRQSMQNGGGPACLRLRVPMREDEAACIHSGVLWTNSLGDQLEEWGRKHYRDRLEAKDLGDPCLLEESRRALDTLTRILDLGSLYPFQWDGESGA